MNFAQLIKEAKQGRPVKSHSGLVKAGDIFVAVPGSRVDGSKYIDDALNKGASWIVAQTNNESIPDKVVIHDNPAVALGHLARSFYHTDQLDMSIIGITGTNGKTTVSYLLEHIFTKSGLSTGVVGTVNYRWMGKTTEASMTTPDCLKIHEMLSMMDKDGVEMVIMEVSSHALAQDRVAGIDFDAGVFTNLTQDHLDYHQDMEEYFQAKAKLFLSQERKKPFKAVINKDDLYGQRLVKDIPGAMGFGLDHSKKPALSGKLIKNDRTGVSIECSYNGLTWTTISPLCGRHNASNLLAAQGVGLSMGLSPEKFKCLEAVEQVPGRLEKVPNNAGLDIYVDYAHTPDALENICLSIKSLGFARMMLVFGCGGNRDRTKRALMGQVAARYADVVFLTSDNPRLEDPVSIIEDVIPGLENCQNLHVEVERRKAIGRAVKDMKTGDVLVVAGKGHENYQDIMGKKHWFSDVEEIKKAVTEL